MLTTEAAAMLAVISRAMMVLKVVMLVLCCLSMPKEQHELWQDKG